MNPSRSNEITDHDLDQVLAVAAHTLDAFAPAEERRSFVADASDRAVASFRQRVEHHRMRLRAKTTSHRLEVARALLDATEQVVSCHETTAKPETLERALLRLREKHTAAVVMQEQTAL